jgi:sortase (surface protein transpeptidase)
MLRRVKKAVIPLVAGMMLATGVTVGVSASTGIALPSWGDEATGTRQPGPLGLNPLPAQAAAPVAITIPDAEVDAEVERNQIVDGVMLDPSGPWVVSWYQETGLLGEIGNAVMSGHVDYWDVGPAVFWTVAELQQGEPITVRGDNGATYTFAVEWVKTYDVSGLTPEAINEIVGPTDYRAITLITCGGDFDYDAGEYLSRTVIRGRLVEADGVELASTTAKADAASEADAADAPAELAVGGTASITESGVNLRASATTGADVVTTLTAGQQVSVIGGPEDADGYTWWQIRLPSGEEGWIAADFLAP